MSNEQMIKSYSIKELSKFNFRIPLYQRQYAWGEDEISQLIEDLKTFNKKFENKDKRYFLGNIVVFKNDEFYDVIDGQQRLTTLYLMLKMINNNNNLFSLDYEIREEARKFLKSWDGKFREDIKNEFADAISTINRYIIELGKEKLQSLLDRVYVVITKIPENIDVVKYFEVMNNRGKQLEKHQILKAKFLQVLNKKNSKNWAKIWDYCSDMTSTIEDLIYYNDFDGKDKKEEKKLDLRKELLEKFMHDKFRGNGNSKDENNNGKNEEQCNTISNIIEEDKCKTDKEEKDSSGRKEYKSIIKFPIFLIHTLKIFIAKYGLENSKNLYEIIVNDRYLLDYFYKDDTHTEFLFDKKDKAKNFIELMLKLRILFDYFVFKRFEDKVELFGRDSQNKDLLMIELLFNVSAPQYFSQDWVAVLLAWLLKKVETIKDENKSENKIDFTIDNELIEFLEEFDRDFAKVRLNEEKSIIGFINEKLNDISKQAEIDYTKKLDDILDEVLNKGTSTPHYWFYKLDYLLWKDYKGNENREDKNKIERIYWNGFKILKNANVENFKLSRLNSIEHIFPQNPEIFCGEWNEEECSKNCFGNLALISNHLNSSFSNQCFENKRRDLEKQLSRGTIESLKLLLVYSKYDEWNEKNCNEHYQEMKDLLKNSLDTKNPPQ